MKAAVRRKYCSPDQIRIEDIPQPRPGDTEVLIRVHAATVNRTDCANLTGKPAVMHMVVGFLKPKLPVLGTDFAGEIVETGKEVSAFQIGDCVFGFMDLGASSHAEYTCISEDKLFRIPDNIDYKTAAAGLEGAHYAYTFVHKSDIRDGQRILINGATGGIGSALIQFVRQFDVQITATCDTKNIDLIKSLGANKIYDYTQEDFTTDTKKYDFIFDAVGKSTYGRCKTLLKPNGTYISSELGPYGQNLFLAISAPLFRKKVIFPVPYKQRETIPYICDLLTQGKFKPVIDREYKLDDIAEAFGYVIQGLKTGNVVVDMND